MGWGVRAVAVLWGPHIEQDHLTQVVSRGRKRDLLSCVLGWGFPYLSKPQPSCLLKLIRRRGQLFITYSK